jgi:hypothetical protein
VTAIEQILSFLALLLLVPSFAAAIISVVYAAMAMIAWIASGND